MSTPTPLYDKTSKDSILAYARLLLGKSIRSLHGDAVIAAKSNRGALGQCVEQYHFKYAPNNKDEPDFPEAGVELKCTPLKKLRDGSMVSKERLVLNIIDYLCEASKDFRTSSFWKKNSLILLMFYLYVQGCDNLDLVFRIIRLWSIPKEDMKIFMDDWAIIHEKICKGLAHELHEGDTFYLAACPKGSIAGAEMRRQLGTDIKAQQRAYSIKSAYLNQIILDSLAHPEMISGLVMTDQQRSRIEAKKAQFGSIVKDAKAYKRGQTFQDYVLSRFSPFIGKSVRMIERELGVAITKSPKAISYALCRAILGVKEQKIAEFEKAGVLLKTVRLEHTGTLKEAMSFSQIKYKEIIGEDEWAESEWYQTLTKRFFFVVFRKPKKGGPKDAVLEKVFFWAMPYPDLKQAEGYWRDTRDKVRAGDYSHFLKQSEHPVCHVRPKAKNSAEKVESPQGKDVKKYCYWLNRKYVLNVVANGEAKC